MPDPYFSVVIPTYNRASFIREAVQSVLRQSYRNFEVIVVDDGSTDSTESVVQSVQDTRLRYFRKLNGERGAARNFGVREARGTYVTFLDSDDTVYPHHLQTAYDFLQHQTVEFCHLGFDMKDTKGNVLRESSNLVNINRNILSGNVLSCNGVFVQKSVLLQNPFSEDRALSSLEDWELWIRLGARYTIYSVAGITSTIIHHEERSVVSGNPAAIETKVDHFISAVTQDPVNQKQYGEKLRWTAASAHTYAALHLKLANASRASVGYHFSMALKLQPGILFTRRSAVIILMMLGIK
ncbi:MAG: glycosyltransferase family 2 protein [Cyclobacteriaceae bacterium]|nr:glycosyltransferase family 2 protein [Cyclobacteriaceae bacterium]